VLDGVCKRFGSFAALHPLHLEVAENEMLALLGPSGCGKTTTLRLIAGFETPDAGRVLIADRDVTRLPPARRRLGMVFQNYSLFPHMTVADNVAFGLRMQGVPRAERDPQVRTMLETVQLASLAERYPRQLSGGQQQRVALARALAAQPRILLLDEPLGALDKNLRESMQFELRTLHRRLGLTGVLVTHDQEEALSLSDRVAVMRAGRIVQIGAPDAIYAYPATRFVSTFLGTSNIIEGRAAEGAAMMAGPGSAARIVLSAPPPGPKVTLSLRPERVVLGPEAQGLSNRFTGQIRSVAFRGAYAAYELAIPALGRTDFYAHRAAEGGDETGVDAAVPVGWRPEDAVIVEDDQ
jgi:putative spermidine/putrescine transport system ATP-binding protein